MMISQPHSLSPDFFAALYDRNPDPWQFKTSEYEAQKYANTLAALPKARYQSAFEIGGSIGILTEQLGDRCEQLLSVDVVPTAQQEAIARCRHLPHVHFQIMQVPHEFPTQTFDLVILSEVGYYWCLADLELARQKIHAALVPGGHLLLVHWIVDAEKLPSTGEQVHDTFQAWVPEKLRSLQAQRHPQYRLDLLERL